METTTDTLAINLLADTLFTVEDNDARNFLLDAIDFIKDTEKSVFCKLCFHTHQPNSSCICHTSDAAAFACGCYE